MLARACKAQTIIEFGTSFGFSSLHLAAALRDNGGGQLISTELEPAKAARARNNLSAADLLDLVEIREGDALQTLSSSLPDAIDLVPLDGAKGLYAEILGLLEPRLRVGAQIVADDANASSEYLAYARAPESGYLSYSLAGGVELSVRLG